MDKSKALELTLVQWIAKIKALPSAQRGQKFIKPNFEELFQQWKDLDGSFDDLYETLLPKAIKAHLPNVHVARGNYKSLKDKLQVSEKEYIDNWNATIEAIGQDTFFEFFPAVPLDKDDEPKVYGNMSATEYRAQRRYADQFPTLNTDELVKQWRSQQEYNLDVEDTLENVLGDDNETNS